MGDEKSTVRLLRLPEREESVGHEGTAAISVFVCSSVRMECIAVIRRREKKKTQLLPIRHGDSVGERV